MAANPRAIAALSAGLLLAAACSSGGTGSASATRADLWNVAQKHLKSAGNGTYSYRFATATCTNTDADLDHPCEGVGRKIEEHGIFNLDPFSVTWSHTLTRDDNPSHPQVQRIVVTRDRRTFVKWNIGDEKAACWRENQDSFLGAVIGGRESQLPWGVQVLVNATVTDRKSPPTLPAEIMGTAPAGMAIGLLNSYVGLVAEVPEGLDVPVHLFIDRQGHAAGVAVSGIEIVQHLTRDPKAGSIQWGPAGGLFILQSDSAKFTVARVGNAPAIEAPSPSEVIKASDGPAARCPARS